MNENQKETESTFPSRFQRFLDAENISVGRLASLISSDEDTAKNNRVKIGRWLSGKVSPSYEGLIEIAGHYQLNLNWLMMGVGEMKLTDPIVPEVLRTDAPAVQSPSVNTEEVVTLRAENEGLKAQIGLLKVENEKVWRLVLPKEVVKELDFLKSDSQLTAQEFAAASQMERNRIGFEYAKAYGATDQAINDLLIETKIIPLNSLAPVSKGEVKTA